MKGIGCNMLSFLNIQCTACESVYTLSIEELNVLVLFKCFECGQYNLYVAGNVLALDQDIMTEGTEPEKRKHVVEIVQLFACEFAGNVLGNVGRVINVNVEMDFQEGVRLKRRNSEKKRRKTRVKDGPTPSVRRVNAPRISRDEVRDFLNIDLNLIDKKWYFDKLFGNTEN